MEFKGNCKRKCFGKDIVNSAFTRLRYEMDTISALMALCKGESTGFTLTMPSNVELWCFVWCKPSNVLNKQASPVAGDLRRNYPPLRHSIRMFYGDTVRLKSNQDFHTSPFVDLTELMRFKHILRCIFQISNQMNFHFVDSAFLLFHMKGEPWNLILRRFNFRWFYRVVATQNAP